MAEKNSQTRAVLRAAFLRSKACSGKRQLCKIWQDSKHTKHAQVLNRNRHMVIYPLVIKHDQRKAAKRC